MQANATPAAEPAAAAADATVDAALPAIGAKVENPRLTVKDVDGLERQPLSVGDAKLAVIFFVSHDCPISNSYAPEINRICRDFKRDVRFTIIHPYGKLPAGEAKRHGEEYGFTVPIVVDGDRAVTRQTGVRTMPEVAMMGADGTLLYRGRIDDLWSDFGVRRAEPTKRELRAAIVAALGGKPVAPPDGEAIGCPIE